MKRLKEIMIEEGILFGILFLILSTIYKIIKVGYIKILNIVKINEKYIVFVSKPDFSDNSKYLYNYMQERYNNNEYKYIWLVSKDCKKCMNIKNNTMFVKLNSKYHSGQNLKALYYISKAKMLFFTHQSPMKELKKKKSQVIINLWHGCGYKSSEMKDCKWIEKNPMDYALVPGKVFVDTKSSFWGCNKNQILTIGYPRYDLLFKSNINTETFINKINRKNKMIIWMPTFRKTKNGIFPEEKKIMDYDLPLLSSDNEVKELNKICKENNITLIIKRHPYQLKYSCEKIKLSNILFMDNNTLNKNNIELYSLLKYTNGLITDYSSVAIDYLLLNKPIAFTLDDFEEYSKLRGFVFKDPKKYMPGHHIYNFENMKKYIEDIGNDKDPYKEDRQAIMNEVHNPCDNYCERIVNKIEKIMEEKNEKDTKKN